MYPNNGPHLRQALAAPRTSRCFGRWRRFVPEATVDDRRNSVRDRAANLNDVPREVIEVAFAHAFGDAAERA